jgi:hypothetical protein
MPYLTHPPCRDNSNNTWRRVQVMKLLFMQFSPICRLVTDIQKNIYGTQFYVVYHFRLAANLRIWESISPLPHASSWSVA